MADLAPGRQLGHQLFEGDVLVSVGIEGRPADPGEQAGEGRIAGEVAAEHEGVGEEADQPFDLAVAAVGDRRADRQVLLPRVAAEEGLEGGREDHEERGALPPGERQQGLPGPGREERPHLAAGEALPYRPRAVGGEGEHRGSPGEGRPPVRELPRQDLAGEPAPLPDGEIRILDGERRQGRRAARRLRAIDGDRLAEQDLHRPAVGHDVMDDEDQHGPGSAEVEEGRAQERPAPEVERQHREGGGEAPGLPLPPALGERREVGHRQLVGPRWGDPLHRLAAHDGEGGAESLVAGDHLGEAAREGGDGQAASTADQLHPPGDVVERALRLELVEKPEPLLGERERQGAVPRDGDERRDFGPPRRAEGRLDPGRERPHGRRLEQLREGELDAEGRAHPRRHPGGEERVPPEVEEVLRKPHPLPAQHLRPDRRQHLLERRPRGVPLLHAILRLPRFRGF